VTFVLSSGGHNAGVVNPPGDPHDHYRVSTKRETDRYVDPDTWLVRTPPKEGSWWSEWVSWLEGHSGGAVAPPPMGAADRGYPPLEQAPGSYVLAK
jgi:polyhydroxyalkanoate synthase